MRIVADSNIQKSTVVALRGDGHDVVWVMERVKDPGDRAILEEAAKTQRVVITAAPRCIERFGAELEAGAFLKVGADGRVRRRSKSP